MKVFPYAVFIYYTPFICLDFVIQGTATERSLDVRSQDPNSVICFSTYMLLICGMIILLQVLHFNQYICMNCFLFWGRIT